MFSDDRGKKGVRLIQLLSRSEPHRENMKDDYNRIAQRAVEEKKAEALQKWFVSKIPNYYILIDPDYKNCNGLQKWQANAATVSN
jgi:peptidyl-prolyl cis-trans isomerase SurA